jgi:hypothetical protein
MEVEISILTKISIFGNYATYILGNKSGIGQFSTNRQTRQVESMSECEFSSSPKSHPKTKEKKEFRLLDYDILFSSVYDVPEVQSIFKKHLEYEHNTEVSVNIIHCSLLNLFWLCEVSCRFETSPNCKLK